MGHNPETLIGAFKLLGEMIGDRIRDLWETAKEEWIFPTLERIAVAIAWRAGKGQVVGEATMETLLAVIEDDDWEDDDDEEDTYPWGTENYDPRLDE